MFIKENFKLYVLSVFLILNLFIWYAISNERSDNLKVAFLDVGQGDAIFIETPERKQILIDGGANRGVIRQLSKVMPFYDRSIDMVILSHPDADHVGGLPAVLEDYQVDFVMESGVNSDSETYSEFKKLVEEEGAKKILAQQGQVINLGDGVSLNVLFPVGDVSEFETNTASIVLKLVYGKNSFLFTGDLPKSVEKYLVESFGDYLDVDVFKLGHHGSKTSNSELFLGFASPEYAIASVGENNRYNHPDKQVLDLLDNFGIDLFRTDEDSVIVFESDGSNLYIKK